MRAIPQELPSEDSEAGRVARRLAALQGPAIQAPDGSATGAELLALGDAVAAARERVEQSQAESFVDTAEELLAEWEAVFGLPTYTTATQSTRRASMLALSQSARAGTPQDLEALAASIVSGATLRERTVTEATTDGDARRVFLLRVAIGASAGDSEIESRLRSLLAPAIPAHCALEFAATEYDAITTESSEALLTETGEEITTET